MAPGFKQEIYKLEHSRPQWFTDYHQWEQHTKPHWVTFMTPALGVALLLLVAARQFKVGVVRATAPNPGWWTTNTGNFSQYPHSAVIFGRSLQKLVYIAELFVISPL
jgi:hypothetical protein